MKSIFKLLVIGSVVSAAAMVTSQADARVIVGVGVGIGAPVYPGYYGGYGYYGYPGYWGPRYDAPDVVVVPQAAPPVPAPAAAPAPADPIFYPKNGQSAAQLEADRQQCNRWATGQPAAMADASVFQRATFACMEGRGYAVR